MNRPPNILMVLADQMHADWMGCAGHPQVQTPSLDALAASGTRLTNAYCQNPICTPSRVSILSGQYPHNHGFYGLSGNANLELPNLFGHLRGAGYRTAGYGKLHLPCSPRNWVADALDEFGDTYEDAAGNSGRSAYFDYLEERGLRHLEDSWHNTECYGSKAIPIDAMPSKLPLEHTMEMWCARQAMEFMARDDSHPFCLQISLQKPHHPLLPNPEFWERYPADLELPETWNALPDGRPPHFKQEWEAWRNYPAEFASPGDSFEDFVRRCWRGTLACVTQIDHVFGLLMQFLKERGLEDNTIVIFSSDHGAYHGIHGQLEKAPGICSDAICRVPMIWRVPGVTQPGTVQEQLVETVDFVPTLTHLAGAPTMETADGCEISGLLAGEQRPVHGCAVTENAWSKAIRWDRWRLVAYPRRMFGGETVDELYDLEADPLEQHNLAKEPSAATVLAEGRKRLLEWMSETTRLRTPTTMQNTPQLLGRSRVVPLGGDNRAVNAYQPRHRDDVLINYL